ncbi:hypothetical protein EMIHUDRAFT_236440 [Emiliania huxleyi CCMP1516]|uniref:Regulator of chromosome condensation n=2 Tax=Emiliania huxleyi TaxID=2903 RepID=A0A0D3JTE2_EMIH1|nr:hypothetical protein EMIHUDRAFT_236440 [Emiliania huxleyi CCMP1516]EOD26777.1 hypothetical protein EMIHUDRAFT_236440 [Emiliania huxleyi CCMP1516]|eukprot:XP_005779206.1 hypothetical protein EMIHUDRAFT_236440 [Emiliania huxleyi CCMP1516]
MSGWGDLFKDKYEERIDESTGETIMVEKGTKHHKLDAQGNIVDPDAAPAPSPFAAAGGFQFGGAPASSGGGFTFGGGAPAAANGGVAKRGRTNALVRTGNESGELLIAGNGDCGQLGFGDEGKRDSVKLLLLPIAAAQICQVACGGLHSIALGLDGRLWSWGCNDDEVLGRPGEEAEPRESVTCGDNHSAALARDGRVFTWGTYKDSNGYIGYSPDLAKAGRAPFARPLPLGRGAGEPRRVLPGVTARAIASGTDHTVLNENFRDWVKARLKEDAAWDATEAATLYLEHRCENVYSCGLNNMGQLGLGSLDPNKTSTPTLLGGLQGLGVCMLAGGELGPLLGLGDGVQQQPTPTLVAALCGVAGHKIVCGHSHNLLCTGRGEDETAPTLVEGPELASRAVLDASTGGQHSVLVGMPRPS